MPGERASYVPVLGFRRLTRLYDPAVRLTIRDERFEAEHGQERHLPRLVLIQLATAASADIWSCGTNTLTRPFPKSRPLSNL